MFQSRNLRCTRRQHSAPILPEVSKNGDSRLSSGLLDVSPKAMLLELIGFLAGAFLHFYLV